ncbi:SapC family protein [Larsenimonas salina]|uniref:SapC family protein n=1 Tax=Larsenimonas salina TaxID=1295565 RepID=UPI002072DA47|nr:SapC family protein [Larsenimonas salina]MCM5704925.1 SapC family protein [Larsenimonas salina]
MANPFIISPMKCRGLGWLPSHTLDFAADQPLVPLHAGEMAEAAFSMPLALASLGGTWQLVGVCGLTSERNVFIKQGQWLGQYRPQWLTTWPFDVLKAGDRRVVTFDQASNLLSEQSGEPFFDDKGQPCGRTAEIIATLKASWGKQQTTQSAVAALYEAGLLTPWPESLQSRVGMTMPEVHMVDERRLAALDDTAFLKLRASQALPVAYAVNLSLSQAHLLARMARHNPGTEAMQEGFERLFADNDDLIFDFDQ